MEHGPCNAPRKPQLNPATLIPPLGLQASATWLGDCFCDLRVFELGDPRLTKQCGTKNLNVNAAARANPLSCPSTAEFEGN
jgi:hypothetical protein